VTPERFRQIDELYHSAREQETGARAAFLAGACNGDEDLRREVESLLAQRSGDGPLERPVVEDGPPSGPLQVGAQLGPYRIEGLLGVGGMGRVYKARDTRLGRSVAIKVASARFSERFQREARAISALNHPNICTLYDVGPNYLVMELVEGATLADRIKQGPIPIEEALAVARQIADGLAAAHDQGLVHRDLKPANIKIKPDGTVKVLDFGLAKTSHAAPQPEACATVTLTEAGTIVGTPAYMAPEQARGEEVDKRADIWGFGVVLYEMLTRRRLFQGENTTEILGSVIKEQPDWNRAPAQTRPVLRRCLEKDPKRRLRDIGDAMAWLETEGGPDSPVPAKARPIWWIAATTVLLAAAVLVYFRKPPPEAQVVSRFSYLLPEGQNFSRAGRHVLAISPDGTKLTYVANKQLYLHEMDQLDAQPVGGTNEDPMEPVFSPDGQWLAYFVPATEGGAPNRPWVLKKIALSGGAPVTLGQLPAAPWGATWRNSVIAFGINTDSFTGIQTMSDSGGASETLVSLDPRKERATQPRLLADGKHILFVSVPTGYSPREGQIVVQTLNGKDRRILIDGGSDPRVLPGGQLVYFHRETLLAVPFDIGRLVVTGGPVPLIEGVAETNATWTGQFTVSGEGTLAFRQGPVRARSVLTWVDRQGHEDRIAAQPRVYMYPRLSPDGGRIAVSSLDEENDVWVFDLVKDILTRLTFGPTFETHPIWTPDGKYVLFDNSGPSPPGAGNRGDIIRKAADGTGATEALTEHMQGGYPLSFSPDGKSLVFRQEAGAVGLFLLPLAPKGEPHMLIAAGENAEISPDGRWIAYDANESGRLEVYVRPFPAVDTGRWQISAEGGTRPMWARSGHELFFLTAGNRMMAVPVQAGPSAFTYAKPQPLFDARGYSFTGVGRTFDISADGKRFLMIKDVPSGNAAARPSIIVVSHWFDEVKARMLARR
jgi:eukaryotic-like serine/threonine-protein kinase